MPAYCECKARIVVFMPGRGFTGPPDKNHDLCARCFDRLRCDSI